MATQTPKTAPAARKLARVVPKTQSKPAEAPVASKYPRASPPAFSGQESTQSYRMPVDVSDWIEQAESRLRHAATEIARLKEENKQLKHSNRVMEQRVMGRSDD